MAQLVAALMPMHRRVVLNRQRIHEQVDQSLKLLITTVLCSVGDTTHKQQGNIGGNICAQSCVFRAHF